MATQPVDEVTTAKILADVQAAAGGAPDQSIRKIADRHKVSMRRVRTIAAEHNLAHAWSARANHTAAATAAKTQDAKARRAEIMNGLLDDAQRLRAQLFAPAVVYSFGGKENTYAERHVPEPPTRDKRDLMNAISLALNASLRLDDHDRGTDVDDAKSMLDDLFEGLSAAWDQHHQEQPEQPAEDES